MKTIANIMIILILNVFLLTFIEFIAKPKPVYIKKENKLGIIYKEQRPMVMYGDEYKIDKITKIQKFFFSWTPNPFNPKESLLYAGYNWFIILLTIFLTTIIGCLICIFFMIPKTSKD